MSLETASAIDSLAVLLREINSFTVIETTAVVREWSAADFVAVRIFCSRICETNNLVNGFLSQGPREIQECCVSPGMRPQLLYPPRRLC
jgi:hypothetical protein